MAGTSSSLADRLSRQYLQQTGRDPSADLAGFGEYAKTAMPSMLQADTDAYERSKARWKTADKIAWGATMIPFTAGLSSILSPAAAGAAGGASKGYSSPGIFSSIFGGGSATAPAATVAGGASGLSRLGSVLNSRGFEGLANAGLSLFGQHQQGKANDQARRDTLMAQQKAIEFEQQRLATEAQNANLDREDARALNTAIQALEAKKFALQQEQYAYERGVSEEDRGQRNEYRTSFQLPAARRMASILGLG